VYNTGTQTVAAEADIPFSSNGILTSGITHTANTSQITITNANASVYMVAFSVTSSSRSQFALYVDGSLAAGTIYGSDSTSQQNNGQALIALSAGTHTLTLRNHTSMGGAVTLQTNAGGTQTNTSASILIEKLG
jgi:hypothetical protein